MAPGVGGGEYGSDLSNLILAWPPQLVEKEAAHAWIHMMLPPRSLRTWERFGPAWRGCIEPRSLVWLMIALRARAGTTAASLPRNSRPSTGGADICRAVFQGPGYRTRQVRGRRVLGGAAAGPAGAAQIRRAVSAPVSTYYLLCPGCPGGPTRTSADFSVPRLAVFLMA